MMMQDETEKKSIRNLMQAVVEPEMHPDFESRVTPL